MRAPTLVEMKALLWHRRLVQVIVFGHQKSGTSAIASLLAKASGLDYAQDPLYRLDRGSAARLSELLNGQRTLDSMVSRHRRVICRPIIKDPDLIHVYDQCRRVFAGAKSVFVVRDPRDTIRSIADRLSLDANDLQRPAKEPPISVEHWRKILSGELPHADNYQGASVARVLADRWRRAAQQYLARSDEFLLVRYEDFNRDKQATIDRALAEIGIDSRFAIDPWLDYAFQPKGKTDIHWEERLGRDTLEIIEGECKSLMMEFDYH